MGCRSKKNILEIEESNDLSLLLEIGKGLPLFRCGRGKPPYLVPGPSPFPGVPLKLGSPERGKCEGK